MPKARCSSRSATRKVLCTASVEEKVPPHKRGSGEGWLTAEYGMLPRSTHTRSDREAARGKQSGRTQEIQRLIGRSLRCVFDLAALGERTISLDCDVLQADGGTRTAAITGAFVAAHDAVAWLVAQGKLARSPIRDFVAAVSVGIVDGTPLLDLEYVEDAACDTDMNVVMTASGGFVELQGTAEGATFSRAEMDALLALAGKGIGELVAAQRRVAGRAAAGRGVRLVLASNNPGKLAELAELFAPLGVELVAQGALGIDEADEPHVTFIENALAKARHAARAAGGAAIADDSGLCVDALGGAPGVASAHFAPIERERGRGPRGVPASPGSRQQPAPARAAARRAPTARAHFVGTLVAVRRADDPEPLVAVGRWAGELLEAPRGERRLRLRPAALPAVVRPHRRRARPRHQEPAQPPRPGRRAHAGAAARRPGACARSTRRARADAAMAAPHRPTMAVLPIVAAPTTPPPGDVAERLARFMRPGALTLAALPPLSLYVHLPWCLKKCPYCDFNSHAWRDDAGALPEARYVDALVARPRGVAAVRLGPARAHRLHRRRHAEPVRAGVDRAACSPRSAPACRSSPAARSRSRPIPAPSSASASTPTPRPASRGCRSACRASTTPSCAALGRVHDAAQARAAVEEAKAAFATFNLDLMYALPGQTLAELRRRRSTRRCRSRRRTSRSTT